MTLDGDRRLSGCPQADPAADTKSRRPYTPRDLSATRSSFGPQYLLESDMARVEPVACLEAVGIRTPEVGGELNSVAAYFSGNLNSGFQQLCAYSPGTEFGVHVHGFDLAAQSSEPLEVPEDHQLTHADHGTGHLCHQEVIAGRSLNL